MSTKKRMNGPCCHIYKDTTNSPRVVNFPEHLRYDTTDFRDCVKIQLLILPKLQLGASGLQSESRQPF
jgi:hypothetical protein